MATMEKPSNREGSLRIVPTSRGVRAAVSLVPVAIAVQSLAFALLLGADGSPGWRAGRAALALAIGAAALGVELRSSRSGRAWSAVALAMAGLTVGAGIGVMHVAKSDLTLGAVAALVVLAAGIVLTATAARGFGHFRAPGGGCSEFRWFSCSASSC